MYLPAELLLDTAAFGLRAGQRLLCKVQLPLQESHLIL